MIESRLASLEDEEAMQPMQVLSTTGQIPTPVDTFRVALICMPFATALVPSIQVGLLTARLGRLDFRPMRFTST